MAHLLDETTGRAAFFTSGGQHAWHRLGTVVQDAQTSAEALRLAALDWTVTKCPLWADLPNGQTVPVPRQYAISRDDSGSILGTVGETYRPLQNVKAFEFFDALVGEKLAMYETAGAIKGGSRIWILARLPNEIQVTAADTVKPYVLLTNSHDGTSGIRIFPTTVRVVCNNTLTLAVNRSAADEGLTIRHCESLERRIDDAREKLNIINRRLQDFDTQAKQLARKQLTTVELADYFAALVKDRSEKQQKKLFGKFFDNLTNARNDLPGISGTAWAAYNAVSEYADHSLTIRGKSTSERQDNRANSIWFGTANALKQKAFNLALATVA